MNFLVQCNHRLIPTEELGWAVMNKTKFQNWIDGNINEGHVVILTNGIRNTQIVGLKSKSEIEEIIRTKDYIPVGEIDFVESHLGKKITPINVPKELNTYNFTRRNVYHCKLNTVEQMMVENNINKMFIKRADILKSELTGVYTVGQIRELMTSDELKDADYICQYDISSDIVAEYRIFVFKNQVLGCHQYSGDDFSSKPDEKTVREMIDSYKDCPPAYTLDVAIINDNGTEHTVVIEVHNFISCGLYGFDSNRLLSMVSAAYKFERCEHK